jgi:hypothetical protein
MGFWDLVAFQLQALTRLGIETCTLPRVGGEHAIGSVLTCSSNSLVLQTERAWIMLCTLVKSAETP